jgi:hypothetical protein
MGLADPVGPRAVPAQFSQSPMCSMRRTKLPFRPRPELGARTAKARYVAFQLRPSLPAPSVIEPRLASLACEPPRRAVFEMLRRRRNEPRDAYGRD